MIPQFYTMKDVMGKLCICEFTLRKLVKQKEIATTRFGRNVRISETSLQAFIERRTTKGRA